MDYVLITWRSDPSLVIAGSFAGLALIISAGIRLADSGLFERYVMTRHWVVLPLCLSAAFIIAPFSPITAVGLLIMLFVALLRTAYNDHHYYQDEEKE